MREPIPHRRPRGGRALAGGEVQGRVIGLDQHEVVDAGQFGALDLDRAVAVGDFVAEAFGRAAQAALALAEAPPAGGAAADAVGGRAEAVGGYAPGRTLAARD